MEISICFEMLPALVIFLQLPSLGGVVPWEQVAVHTPRSSEIRELLVLPACFLRNAVRVFSTFFLSHGKEKENVHSNQ